MKICSEQAQWRRQGSEVGGWQSWLVRSPPPLPPIPLPLLFVPSPLSLLSEIFPLLFLSPVFLPKIQLGVWGSAEGSPSGAPAAKAFLPYFETRIRSGCNDFGSFCTDQNIHLNQDRSYWLLPRYTSYDYFSSDLCWSQDRSWRGLGAVAPVCPPPWRCHWTGGTSLWRLKSGESLLFSQYSPSYYFNLWTQPTCLHCLPGTSSISLIVVDFAAECNKHLLIGVVCGSREPVAGVAWRSRLRISRAFCIMSSVNAWTGVQLRPLLTAS